MAKMHFGPGGRSSCNLEIFIMFTMLAWFAAAAVVLVPHCGCAPTAPPTNTSSNAGRCCSLLQLRFNEQVFLPQSENFTASLSSYWSVQSRVEPACVVSPGSAEDVAAITQALVNSTCQFAIRSGGHNPFPDNNIAAPGVTLDLSRLSTVTVAQNGTNGGTVAQIGPGARWGPVYDALAAKGLSVGGGRAATVGVGGLTLGGGNSFFAARYGFVCDNVENFQVVLASGKIVNANSKQNSDLWQVLKGGSNNFGIVTRIDLTAFEGTEIWGGIVLHPETTIPQQINAFVNFTEKIDSDPYASLITFWAYTSATNTTIVENAYEYTKAVTEPPAPFADLLAIEPKVPNTTTLRLANLTSLTTELEAKADLRDLFATLSFANDAETISQVYNISQRLLQPVKDTKGLNWITMFQPIPSIIAEQSVKRGGNVLGLERAKGNQVLFLFFVQWDDESRDDAIHQAADQLMQEVTDLTKSTGKHNDWIYLNYALENQDPIGGYGSENVQKMKAASAKYDPNGVFQKLVPGGYKLGNAKPTST